jgi:hypothetical protein
MPKGTIMHILNNEKSSIHVLKTYNYLTVLKLARNPTTDAESQMQNTVAIKMAQNSVYTFSTKLSIYCVKHAQTN